ncbi:MAG: hypothetical protein KGI54_03745 [Pseudomonadota bacterium]|nr:hypothetical protein [Pseudomonadota bacterium]
MQQPFIDFLPTLAAILLILGTLIQFASFRKATPNNAPAFNEIQDDAEISATYFSIRGL